MQHVVYEVETPRIFYGEEGCERHMAHVLDDKGVPDDDYRVENPAGSMYGGRNYHGSVYYSGMPDKSPGEY